MSRRRVHSINLLLPCGTGTLACDVGIRKHSQEWLCHGTGPRPNVRCLSRCVETNGSYLGTGALRAPVPNSGALMPNAGGPRAISAKLTSDSGSAMKST